MSEELLNRTGAHPTEEDRRNPAWWEARYLSGDAPWNTGITPPEVVGLIESGSVAKGWALDLGCGSGVTSRYLAQNGFRVIGLDLSHFALRQGAKQATAAGLSCYFAKASVEDLDFLHVAVTLAVDIGCFHSLSPAARASYVRSLAGRVVSGGYYLLYTFVDAAAERAVLEPSGPSVSLPDLGGFAPWFVLRNSAYGEDRGRVSAWFLMRRT
jgi:SAM-dependent methyltransferase